MYFDVIMQFFKPYYLKMINLSRAVPPLYYLTTTCQKQCRITSVNSIVCVCLRGMPLTGQEHQNSIPKTLGSIPWRGRVRSSFSALRDPPSCVWHAPIICAHVNNPISICCKSRVGLTAGGMETQKHCTQGCSFSPGEAAQISSALHWDKNVI